MIGGRPEIVKLLVQQGADVNHVNKEGKTALTYAILDKNMDNVRCLVTNGSKLRGLNSRMTPPLVAACLVANFRIVKYLVDENADINCKDGDGRTPHSLVKNLDNAQIAKFLVAKGAKTCRCKGGGRCRCK